MLGAEAANTKALVFNVKGEDLLFLDKPNAGLNETEIARDTSSSASRPVRSTRSAFGRPCVANVGRAVPDTGSRQEGVRAYFWTVRDVVREGLLRFMFAEAGDERSQIADLVTRVEAALEREAEDVPDSPATIKLPDEHGETRARQVVRAALRADRPPSRRRRLDAGAGYIAGGTVAAFLRRLDGARLHCGHLIRGADDALEPEKHRIDWESRQVSVIDIHNLHDRAKRFVVGVVVKRLFEQKETTGSAKPLVFLVLDELNKYAPREGWSPDQGGAARHLGARPEPRRDPRSALSRPRARSSGESCRTLRFASSAGSTRRSRSGRSTGFSPTPRASARRC